MKVFGARPFRDLAPVDVVRSARVEERSPCMKPSIWGSVLFALVVTSPCASGGVIRGKLRLPPASAAIGPTSAAIQGGPEDAVVYVEGLPEKVERKLSRKLDRPKIVLTAHRFVPRVLPVAVGTTVRFQNQDRVYHNTFSVSPARRFDLGKYAPGRSKPVTFDRVGVVNLYCDIHPTMAGFIVVLPHRVFTQPGRSGDFALPNLPPGNYTVKVWHPRLGERSREVEIPRRGNVTLRLSFT
jgi:hypothetical protein